MGNNAMIYPYATQRAAAYDYRDCANQESRGIDLPALFYIVEGLRIKMALVSPLIKLIPTTIG